MLGKKKKTIEQKTAETVLQTPETITINGREYSFMPPTSATLIAASAAASKLPRVAIDAQDPVSETLRVGKDCTPVGEIVAILLCGAKGFLRDGKEHEEYEKRIKEMTVHLLEDIPPSELQQLAIALFQRSDVSSFFGLTAFLVEANLLKATKAETTASGQQ